MTRLPDIRHWLRRLSPLLPHLTLMNLLCSAAIGTGMTGVWRRELTDPFLVRLGEYLTIWMIMAGVLTGLRLMWQESSITSHERWWQARALFHRYALFHFVRLLIGALGPDVLALIREFPQESLALGSALLLFRLVVWPYRLPSMPPAPPPPSRPPGGVARFLGERQEP